MKRIRVLAFIMILFLLITVAGLVTVQIFMHERYKTMSEQNRLKVVPLAAPRGAITDRNGLEMVKDELSFNVSVKHFRVGNRDDLLRDLSSALGTDKEAVGKELNAASRNPFVPHVVARDVGIENAIRISEMSWDHPGIILDVTPRRRYLAGASGSSYLGYVGPINREEFQRLRPYGFRIDDRMGRAGLESVYDDYLRGRHGGKQVEVDNRGREVRVLGHREALPGKPIRLTVDLRLQEFCDGLLEGKRGAIVAMSPETGEILALSSSPSYDPNAFIEAGRSAEVSRLLRDTEYPLLNRAIAGTYPPGSVFKLVVAAAALENGVISEETVFNCGGNMVMGGRTFNCWRKQGHGNIALKEALQVSCNVFFWRTGLLLGPDKIAAAAGNMGFGQRSGIDLPFENAGVLPSESWKRKTMREPWYRGETLNYSVGQGYMLASPLQVARMTSALANGGYLVKPYIVEEIDGVSVSSRERIYLGLSEKDIGVVREGMKMAVNMRRGTGVRARDRDIVISGKTGTAQTSRAENHGWFAGFAPFDKAKLTVVVFDEYGGKGGEFAAETTGKIFRKAGELGLL